MTGTNMSGDLKDPQRSIPSGTIAATLSTSLIYFALALLFGASIIGPVLKDKTGKSVASSIAKDDVIPALAPFAKLTDKGEPFLGLIFTAAISECAILLGAVDAIAEVLDFFFLMCYAFVNLVCFLHSILKAPNWRPRFKYYHWSLSLAGAFLCFFIMFASNWKYATVACFLTFVIYKYVEWKGAKKEWGDGIRGLALTTAQYSLQKVEDKDPHPKNWRPQLMILLDGKFSKEHIDLRSVNLLNLAGQLKAGRGLAITVGPNTVLLNFPRLGEENAIEQKIFAEQLIRGVQSDMCMIVAKGITDWPRTSDRLIGVIDIWWIVHDGGILMLIAFLMQQHKVWKGCKLRIFVIANEETEDDTEIMKVRLQKYIYMLRIDAMLFIVNTLDPEVSDDAVQKTIRMEKKNRMRASRSANGFINTGFTGDESFSVTMRASRSANGFINTGFTGDESFSVTSSVNRQISLSSLKAKNTLPSNVTETSFINTPSRRNSNDSSPTLNTPDDNFEDIQLDEVKIQKMSDAMKLNRVILEYSQPAQLVLLSLPKPPRSPTELVESYLEYIEVMTYDMCRVLLISGSGKEVITVDS
uniref:Solute carrier family 12 member 3 n=1 Tax=Panagrolaimus sp. JU765 TaxID=591449 RepID=A0AC34QY31_9BILA